MGEGEASLRWECVRDVDRPPGELAMSAYLDMPEPVPTGIGKLDQLLGGGMTRGITVVGGESSAGKTVLACHATARMAERGQRVVYASYETAWEVVHLRCASAWSHSDEAKALGVEPFFWVSVVNGTYRAGHARYKGLGRRELSRFLTKESMDPVARALTMWDEGPGKNVAVLSSGNDVHELTRTVRAIEGPTPVLVVDYIQIVPTGSARQEDNERVTEVMAALREHAYAPDGGNVLALSSLRKLTPTDRRDSPTMDWFRGSNHVGYDAEQAVVLTVEREKVDDQVVPKVDKDGSTEGRMTVVKNRTGATGASVATNLYGWASMIL